MSSWRSKKKVKVEPIFSPPSWCRGEEEPHGCWFAQYAEKKQLKPSELRTELCNIIGKCELCNEDLCCVIACRDKGDKERSGFYCHLCLWAVISTDTEFPDLELGELEYFERNC